MAVKRKYSRLANILIIVAVFFILHFNIKFSELRSYQNSNSLILDYFIKFWGNTQTQYTTDYYLISLFDRLRIFLILFLGVIFSTSSFMKLTETHHFFTFHRRKSLFHYCTYHFYEILSKVAQYMVIWLCCSITYIYLSASFITERLLINEEIIKILTLHLFVIGFYIINISLICLISSVLFSKLIALIVVILSISTTIVIDIAFKDFNMILLDYDNFLIDSLIRQSLLLLVLFAIMCTIHKLYSLRG